MPAIPSDDGRLADLERLLDVARQLGATVALDPLLSMIAAAAISVLDCERATVFLYDRKAGELSSRLATGVAGAPIEEIRFPDTRGIAGEVARSGVAINIADAYADPRFNPEFDQRSGYRSQSMLTIPLAGHDGAVVGVLQLLNKRGGLFATRDEEIGGFLGTQAGVAIQRQLLLEQFAVKQRIDRDLNIARGIQQGLLPREQPAVPGYDIAGWNRPADETGGDYFDFMPLAGAGLAITIADVTGHGVGPALVVAETRALFRAVVQYRPDLQRAVNEVQGLLSLDLPEGRFVTAFFGVLSPERHTVTYLSAGQAPLLSYVAADESFHEMPAKGLPLGFMPEIEYEPAIDHSLAPGDMVVLLTDGFYEWANPAGAQFGVERVTELVHRHRNAPASEVIAALYRAVVDFSAGTPQGDDLTAVVIKRLPDGAA
jgi:phosphoserine phosphatase